MQRQVDFLAIALRNVVNVFDPSLIVLGGFLASLLAAEPERLLAGVTAQALPGSADDLRIVPAELGVDRLTIGAAELAFARLLADPAGTRLP